MIKPSRRRFLGYIGKICAGLPFAGTSSIVRATGVSEGHRDYSYKEIIGKDIDGVLEKRIGTEFISNTLCTCSEQRLKEFNGRVMVACPHIPPYYVNQDGFVMLNIS